MVCDLSILLSFVSELACFWTSSEALVFDNEQTTGNFVPKTYSNIITPNDQESQSPETNFLALKKKSFNF